MKNILSILACVYIVWVFIEFQSLVDSPGLSFVEEILCLQASQTSCDIQFFMKISVSAHLKNLQLEKPIGKNTLQRNQWLRF